MRQRIEALHDTSRLTAEAFFECYASPGDRILDVGSMNVNGSLREAAPPTASYIGVDVTPGRGVDLVLEDPYRLPFVDAEFDLIVSASCFEHAEFFWETFLEMCRIVKPTGFIYLSVPSIGPYHMHPVDCWRFHPDAGLALANWSIRKRYPRRLIESFQLPPLNDVWTDFVAVFGEPSLAVRRIVDQFPEAQYLRPQKAA
jgi:SAM-dependent methyltransferase